jgi:hypothetical protein
MNALAHPPETAVKTCLRYVATAALAAAAAWLLVFVAPPAHAAEAQTPALPPQALIVQDAVALRAAPRDAATQQARLWQGELVEIRGERLEYVQVWDHQRERGGYVRASQLRRLSLDAAHADELLAVLRFVKDSAGSEGLGFGYGAAWLRAASPAQLSGPVGAEVLDAVAGAAQRLAQRASAAGLSRGAQEALLGQLDAAGRYGIRFNSHEIGDRMQICYDGELFTRVLAMPAASAEQRARAALALTDPACEDPALGVLQRIQRQEDNARLLDQADAPGLPPVLKNRLQMRRASVWSAVAFERSRRAPGGADAATAAERALEALARVDPQGLPDTDAGLMNDAVMHVNASRWAAVPASAPGKGLQLRTSPGAQAGQTCVSLHGGAAGSAPLLTQCSHGVVWTASFSVNREGNAAALAVQPMAGWRELWLLRKQAGGWTLSVLPPAPTLPGIGYAELAGWVPGGRQVLVAREARGEGAYQRRYEVLDLATLAPQRQASDPSVLGAFQRWQMPQWKQQSVSLR